MRIQPAKCIDQFKWGGSITHDQKLRTSFFQVRCFQEGAFRRKIREKRDVFIERKSIATRKKASKRWTFEVVPFLAYGISFVVNGGGDGSGRQPSPPPKLL